MSQGQSFVPESYGAKLVKPELADQYQVIFPNWPDVDGSFVRNIFRILPVPGDCPTFWDDGRIGPWLYAGYSAQIFTPTRRLIFFLGDPRRYNDYSIRQTPYWTLFDRVVTAVNSGAMPHWRNMNLVRLRGDEFDRNKPPMIQRPNYLFLAQVQVVSHADFPDLNGHDPSSPVCLLALRGNVGWTLVNAVRQFRRSQRYKDILDPEHGVLVEFRPAAGGITPQPGAVSFPVNVGYSIDIYTDSDAPVARGTLEQTRWWYDLLYFPPEDEQVRWLADVLPMDVVQYGFARTVYEQFIPKGTSHGTLFGGGDSRPGSDDEDLRHSAPPRVPATQVVASADNDDVPFDAPNQTSSSLEEELERALDELDK